jgi:3-oxoacyl-[acyl-carrier-protein] synthase III
VCCLFIAQKGAFIVSSIPMVACRYRNVHVEGMGAHYPEFELTSAAIEDKIAPLYKRLGIPFGTLERLSGVRTRKMWEPSVMPSTAGAEAVRIAARDAGIELDQIEALISCSVCRDLFEPSTACIMHGKLGLSRGTLAFDVSNACIGFSNGLGVVASLISSGFIKVGVVVSGENPAIMINGNFRHINKTIDTITRDELVKVLPTFTLGGGAVAFVLTHESIARSGIRYLGGVSVCASEHAALCGGNGDFCLDPTVTPEDEFPLMETESSKLIEAAAYLGGSVWPEVSDTLGWSVDDIDHIICHQVGRQVNTEFYNKMGLPFEKDFAIYRDYGNMVSAALPSALMMAVEGRGIKPGDKVLTTAFGSGLNAVFSGFEW